MTDLKDAIAEIKKVIDDAVLSGDLIPRADAEAAQALVVERACIAVSEQADWPEDEHGRTEQSELFARVINAILALAPAEDLAEVQRLRDENASLKSLLTPPDDVPWVTCDAIIHGSAALDRFSGDEPLVPADALNVARAERDAALARVDKLREALKVTGAVLMSEQNRRGGKPFSGRWSIPAIGFSGTVDDALNQANAALAFAGPAFADYTRDGCQMVPIPGTNAFQRADATCELTRHADVREPVIIEEPDDEDPGEEEPPVDEPEEPTEPEEPAEDDGGNNGHGNGDEGECRGAGCTDSDNPGQA